MHTNWLDGTETWVEILKRVLQYNFRDIRSVLESIVDESTLEYHDLLGCSLAAAKTVGHPKLYGAIENDLGNCIEKTAAQKAVAEAAINSVWLSYSNETSFPFTDRLDINGQTTKTKYTMYLLSSYLVLGNSIKINECINILKNDLDNDQITTIVKLSAVIKAIGLIQI